MIEQAKMKAQGLYRQAQMNVETPYAEQIAENERIDKTTTNEMLEYLDKELAALNQIVMSLSESMRPILRQYPNEKSFGEFPMSETASPLTNNVINKINTVRAIQCSLKNLIDSVDL